MHGGDIYSHKIKLDFSININPLGLPLKAKLAYLRALKKISNYPDLDCRALTEALSKKLALPAENLVFGNGASELIQTVLRSEKARRVLLFGPCFTGYERAIKACGGNAVYFCLNEKTDFSFEESDFSRLADVFKFEKPDFVIFTNPNNPNGRLFDKITVKKIIQLCTENGSKLLLDECFIEFCESEEHFVLTDNVYTIRAFTKTYAIPGLRLGYCICPNQEAARRLKTQLPEWNVSSVAQEVGLALLKDASYLKRARALIRRKRKYLSEELKALGFKVYDSDADFILFKDDFGGGALPSQVGVESGAGDGHSRLPLDAPPPTSLYEKLLEEKILIRDCCDYQGLGRGWYRIAVKKHRQNRRLIRAIKKVRGK